MATAIHISTAPLSHTVAYPWKPRDVNKVADLEKMLGPATWLLRHRLLFNTSN